MLIGLLANLAEYSQVLKSPYQTDCGAMCSALKNDMSGHLLTYEQLIDFQVSREFSGCHRFSRPRAK
jgi:hypothetical protein